MNIQTKLSVFIAATLVLLLVVTVGLGTSVINTIIYGLNAELLTLKLMAQIEKIEASVTILERSGAVGLAEYVKQAQTETLRQFQDPQNVRPERYYVIFGQDRQALLPPLPGQEELRISADVLDRMLATRTGTTSFRHHGVTYFTVYRYVDAWDWLIGIALPQTIMFQQRQVYLTTVGSFSLLVFIGVFLLLNFIGKRSIVKPLAMLVNATKAIATGQFDYPLQFPQRDEIGQLADAIHQMAQQLRQNFEQITDQLATIRHDMAARAQIEAALREKHALLQQLIDSTPDHIYVKDLESRFLIANHALIQALGTQHLDEVVGKTDHDFQTPERTQKFFQEERRVLESGQPLINREDCITDSVTGTQTWMLTTKVVLRDPQGNLRGLVGFNRDITERKRAEDELTTTKILLEETFEQSPVSLVLVSVPDAVIRMFNPACREFLGILDEPSPVGMPLLSFHPSYQDYDPRGDAGSVAELPLARALAGQKTANEERMIVRKDGTVRWALVNGTPIYNTQGDLIAGYLILTDITERKRAEDELHNHRMHLEDLIKQRSAELAAERNLLRTLIDNMPDLILVKDRDSRFLALNPALAHLMGKQTPDELIGKNDFDFYPHALAQHYYVAEQALLASGQPSVNQEELHTDPDTGADLWFLATKIPIRDPQGVVCGLVGISRDITERRQLEEELRRHRDHLEELVKARTADLLTANALLRQEIAERQHAENALRDSEKFLSEIIENIPAMVFVKDAETLQFVKFNKAGEVLVGYSRSDFIGKTDYDFFPAAEADFFAAKDRQTLADCTLLDIPEEMIQTRTRGERLLHTKKIPILDSAGKPLYLLGISEDITDRKRAENEIRTLNAELEQRVAQRTASLEAANKELKDFAYVVSHDLKAPLRAISRIVQWLVEDYAGLFDQKGREMAGVLVNRVKRMDSLIDGILEYSRIGRIAGQNQPIDLSQLLPDVIDLLAPPPIIRIEISSELPTLVGDRTRIMQIFQNLLGNAIKFMDKPQGSITVNCADDGAFWRFSVTDSGPGIDPKYHDKIFQNLQTLHPRDEIESTGVGLAIVKKIVEFYGGKIWLESTLNQGSVFYFTIPKAD